MKILVADDSKTTRTLLIASLNKLGHEVIEAINGQQAVELFITSHPDLIILDVIMEGIDGFECARMIRNLNPDDWIPIIFLSGAVDDENIARGINAGGDDYLTKPYSEITLFAKIKAMQRIADMRTSLFEMTHKFRELSSTDSLTGIYNRLQFEKTIVEKMSYAKRYNTKIALLFIDLDKFKIINDTLGHYIGDLLLVEVAKRLHSCVRLDDFIARIGGDEFAVILNNVTDKDISDTIAKKIIHSIEKPYIIMGNSLHISTSIGIASFPTNETNEKNFVQNADLAMYHAKDTGRNNYKYFSTELAEKHNKEINIKNALRLALDKKEFDLTYQPIYDLLTKKINRFEVLAYWENPVFGKIPAKAFMTLAEELELVDQIGTWILRKACEQGKQWHKDGYSNIILSVNISPTHLINKNFPQLIANIIKDTDLEPKLLELNLTETSDLIYSKLSEMIINELHQLGVNITLVDFGTGHSSLSYLRKLPINAIKIDKSFIQDLNNGPNNAKIIKSIISLGNNLDYDIIAEGIATKEQLDFLISNQCKLGQGSYLSRALTHPEVSDLLQKYKSTI